MPFITFIFQTSEGRRHVIEAQPTLSHSLCLCLIYLKKEKKKKKRTENIKASEGRTSNEQITELYTLRIQLWLHFDFF